MEETIEKLQMFESLIVQLGENKLQEAYNAFKNRHGYDLRDPKNGDHLVFDNWTVEEGELVLSYREITPHDCPYYVELRYMVENLTLFSVDYQLAGE